MTSRVTKKSLLETLHKTKGSVTATAQILGVSRVTIYKYLKRWPEAQEILTDQREHECDVAELKLAQLIRNDGHRDQFKAIVYQLETHGRARGWGSPKRLEVTGKDGGPIKQASLLLPTPASIQKASDAKVDELYEQFMSPGTLLDLEEGLDLEDDQDEDE